MKKSILLAGAAMLALASVASAQPGLRFQWDNCSGPNVKTFACGTNTGAAYVATGSYCAPIGTTAVTGNEMVVDIQSASPILPDWWRFKVAGSCRQTAMSGNLLAPADGGCTDYWSGGATGGLANYFIAFGGQQNRARALFVGAVDPSVAGPLNADERYFSFNMSINRTKSAGAGNCAGCVDDVLLVLNEVKLTQPLGVGDFRIQAGCLSGDPPTNGDITNGRALAGQNGMTTILPPGGGATPTRNRTWGGVKALYR